MSVNMHTGQVVDHSMQVVLEPLLICIVGGFVCVNYRYKSNVCTISRTWDQIDRGLCSIS